MPKITFTKDVPHENGEGIAYRRGYCCDVSPQQARRYVKDQVAIDGEHALEAIPTESKPKKRGLNKKTAVISEGDLSTADVKSE